MIDERSTNHPGSVTEGVEAENGEKDRALVIEDVVDREAVAMTITDGADQVEKIVDTADQAAVEVTVVTPVMMKGEEVGKIKSK